jgi:hypothetical protein
VWERDCEYARERDRESVLVCEGVPCMLAGRTTMVYGPPIRRMYAHMTVSRFG